MTTNSKLRVRKTRFQMIFLGESAFGGAVGQKFEKTEEEVITKKVSRKIVISSDTKASPGRTGAEVQISLQTQTDLV